MKKKSKPQKSIHLKFGGGSFKRCYYCPNRYNRCNKEVTWSKTENNRWVKHVVSVCMNCSQIKELKDAKVKLPSKPTWAIAGSTTRDHVANGKASHSNGSNGSQSRRNGKNTGARIIQFPTHANA